MIRVTDMPLADKVAQLFVLRIWGDTAETVDPDAVRENQRAYGVDNAAELVARYQPGGVIYFRETGNIKNPVQVAELSNGLQRAALERSESSIPLLVAADHEGGRVARLSPPATWLPPARTLATLGADAAEDAAAIMARELRAMGIVQTYAPVADVNVNPDNPVIGDRSFSTDPEEAAACIRAQIRGFRRGGVLSAAKHFPGHGDTSVDTHSGRAVITHTREQWEALDLPPFQAAIDEDVDAVMTGHLVFPELDRSEAIATTSRTIVTDLLRKELGYDGVVVTDGLEMSAARMTHDDAETPLRAVQAGVDQLLVPAIGSFRSAVETIVRAVEEGALTVEQLDRSVTRIHALKARAGILTDPMVDTDVVSHVVGCRDHQQRARRLIGSIN